LCLPTESSGRLPDVHTGPGEERFSKSVEGSAVAWTYSLTWDSHSPRCPHEPPKFLIRLRWTVQDELSVRYFDSSEVVGCRKERRCLQRPVARSLATLNRRHEHRGKGPKTPTLFNGTFTFLPTLQISLNLPRTHTTLFPRCLAYRLHVASRGYVSHLPSHRRKVPTDDAPGECEESQKFLRLQEATMQPTRTHLRLSRNAQDLKMNFSL